MAARDIQSTFDIEIHWQDDIFPEVFEMDQKTDAGSTSEGIIYCIIQHKT